ncbi:zinc-binding protein A33-like [Seriola lalandi dorsalis]|uniref:Zinc-binding protein A33-like n=1 Tax=Seriola lalandi dorsalis TaxID=1841481 RepID=A0A3B4WM80_SERLL|nr:zinc-binding protein A33-like [Seriola lalandi dorsalis]
MACSSSLIAEENFVCSICLSVFTKPVSIPCGHTFCSECITNYWDTRAIFPCPLCKEEFHIKPMLRVNTVIQEMAEQLKNRVGETSGTFEQAGNGNVLCSMCTEAKAAVKSCLVCFMSFCEKHLEPHQKVPTLKKHKLINPVENLESRICKMHDEPLDLFCRVDHEFVCEVCKSDHKTHMIVPLEEEAQMRRVLLGNEKTHTDKMIQERQQKIQEIQNSMEASRNNAAKALSCSLHVMTALVSYIKRSHAELTEVIEMKQKKAGTEAEGFIKELGEEIMQINQKNVELNQVSLANDPLKFLENLLSLTISEPQVKDWSNVTLTSDEFVEQRALAKLQTTVMREISMLCDPDLKEKQRHAVDVTLDPDTANPQLTVSADGKQVTHGNRKRNVPNKQERFDHVLNVLAKEGFSSGKFYYEVQVKDKPQWDLGVANQSINRKGDIRLSPKNGYWTIWLRKGNEFTANAGPAITLPERKMPQKVGVFVDYEKGQVSFYDVDARANIFSFTECNFTEKLFPFFSPCDNDEGKNSAPLIITPVKHKS